MLLKNAQESSFTGSVHPSSLSAPIALTPKNTDFHADYLALKNFYKRNLRSSQRSYIK